ncbi:MAG: DNA helicase II [Aquabacterium sp.]|uniref:DEAD/DEAH box helicase n=1 Tax=Aquabacterium sp. TaxID=1872578 RepID=UPI001207818B|nr:3'-5' exonuclease [Aquabacterium sp.]TAK99752.1 MAG: DNA helicase II [Aquabacterium sp.]
MERGEKRFAERLVDVLDEEYLVWYDIPFGPNKDHPDFVVFNKDKGLLVLEVKDWSLKTIASVGTDRWTINELDVCGKLIEKSVSSPFAQARQHIHAVVDHLKRDRLLHQTGRYRGQLICPWGWGVVLTNISRKQFLAEALNEVIPAHLVICKDEMIEAVDHVQFENRIVAMLPYKAQEAMSEEQVHRMRWMLHREMRVGEQASFFGADDEPPSTMKVLDLVQEQLARGLGEGHRVIHGVAGSGKTMILSYRASYLAQAKSAKPILVICFNVPLSAKIRRMLKARGEIDNIEVINFNKWCRRWLVKCNIPLPKKPNVSDFHREVVALFLQEFEAGCIPAHAYQAVLIDEGHDFAPEWLGVLAKMVDPVSNSLLLLYDDCQSIYPRERTRQFSFLSVGIQARGRTTILDINYRNTRQILQLASVIARDLLSPQSTDEDGVPILKPVGCGRDGESPRVFFLSSPQAEIDKIVDLMAAAHREGHAWADMAVLCRAHWQVEKCKQALHDRGFPITEDISSDDFVDAISVMTMHVSKGLEFPVVALCGVGGMPVQGTNEKDEAKVFYVAATRATNKLFVPVGGNGEFGKLLKAYVDAPFSEEQVA